MFRAELEQFHESMDQDSSTHETLPRGIEGRGCQEEGHESKKKSMTEDILRIRMVLIRLFVIGGIGEDIEKIGIGKIIIWETL